MSFTLSKMRHVIQHLRHSMGDGRQTVVNRVTVEAWIFIVEVFPCVGSLCGSGNRTPGPHHCAGPSAVRLVTPATGSAASGARRAHSSSNVPHQKQSAIRRCTSLPARPRGPRYPHNPTPQNRTSGRSLRKLQRRRPPCPCRWPQNTGSFRKMVSSSRRSQDSHCCKTSDES